MSDSEKQFLNQIETTFDNLLAQRFSEFKLNILKELGPASLTTSNSKIPEKEERLLKAGEAARALGISTRTLTRWRENGDIPFIKRKGISYYNFENVLALNRGESLVEIAPRLKLDEIPKRGRKPTHSISI